MKILLDTNIYLDFYRSSDDKLQILDELYENRECIVFPEQIYNEILRNIIQILTGIRNNISSNAVFPNMGSSPFLLENEHYMQIISMKKDFDKGKKALLSYIDDVIIDTSKDHVLSKIKKIYQSESILKIPITDGIVEKAKKRQLLGNPPRAYKKTDSMCIGDEIIWESVLSTVNESLVVVSRDNTYKFNYEYLSSEYKSTKMVEKFVIVQKIRDALNDVGKRVSPKIEELEERQIEEITAGSSVALIIPVVRDGIVVGEAPMGEMAPLGFEDVKVCYNCMRFTQFNGVRCMACGAHVDE